MHVEAMSATKAIEVMLTEKYKSIMQKVKQMSLKRGPRVTLGEGPSARGKVIRPLGTDLV